MKWTTDEKGNWHIAPSRPYTHRAQCFYTGCARCGKEDAKRDMFALAVRLGSYGKQKTLCHYCHRCYANLLEELGVADPL